MGAWYCWLPLVDAGVLPSRVYHIVASGSLAVRVTVDPDVTYPPAGKALMVRVGLSTVTSHVAFKFVFSLMVAVILVVPAAMAVTTPLWTVATLFLLDVQEMV